jgi:predicted lysophospholipase L1 biosynthesis ABC-type transport system permease subunit
MGIPVIRGRGLADSDRADSARVGVIDTELAKRVFGGGDPIGKRFRRSTAPGHPNREPWSEIVGVVGHVRNDSLEKDVLPQVYWPETQRAQDRAALVIRTAGDPAAYAKAVVAEIQQENPEQPVYDVRTMRDWVARSMQTRTLTTTVVSLFGFASVLLACLGLYGVISYTAGLRLREFGIRLALGATAQDVRRAVIGQAARLVGVGLLLGGALCWPAGQAIRSLLFGVGNLDVVSWTLAPGLLICVGLLAALGPAIRAAKADPAQTLRAE